MAKAQAYICDICGQREIGTSQRPEGWEQLRIPRTVKLKRKGKGGRTHSIKVGRVDACKYCVNAFLKLADDRATKVDR